MSKVIDFSQPLSDFDRQYLLDRGQGHLIVNLEKTPDGPVIMGSGMLHREYGSMQIAELRGECEARELPKTGGRDTLVARLRTDDDNG